MKNTLTTFILGLCLFCFYSCYNLGNSENIVSLNADPELRVSCSNAEQVRMKLDEERTLIVDYCYQEDQLLEIEFDLDTTLPSDKQLILNFSGVEYSSSEPINIIILNKIEDFTNPEEVLARSNTGFSDDYSCECNKKIRDEDYISPCLLAKMSENAAVCYGSNYCEACSVVVGMTNNNNEELSYSSSLILLPNK